MTHLGVSVVSRVVSWKQKKKVVILHRRSVSSVSASVSSASSRPVVVHREHRHIGIVADIWQQARVSLTRLGCQWYLRRRLASSGLSMGCGVQAPGYGGILAGGAWCSLGCAWSSH